MPTARQIIQTAITPWNEEITGRIKFAAMDAGMMADDVLKALDEAGLKVVEK